MANTKSRRNIRSKRNLSKKNRSRKNRNSRRVKGGILGYNFRQKFCKTRNNAIACDYAATKNADYRPIADCNSGKYEEKTIAQIKNMTDETEKNKWTQDLKCNFD